MKILSTCFCFLHEQRVNQASVFVLTIVYVQNNQKSNFDVNTVDVFILYILKRTNSLLFTHCFCAIALSFHVYIFEAYKYLIVVYLKICLS